MWAVFLALLLGGGLGAHLKILSSLAAFTQNAILDRMLVSPVRAHPLFEDHRGNYIFITLFDTHYLLNWLFACAAVVSLYLNLRSHPAHV